MDTLHFKTVRSRNGMAGRDGVAASRPLGSQSAGDVPFAGLLLVGNVEPAGNESL